MDIKLFTKRLQTVQNMTDSEGVKEICEILMEYIEQTHDKNEIGFKSENSTDSTN